MKLTILAFGALLLWTAYTSGPATWDQLLKEELFSNYDPMALPSDETVDVSISMALYGITEVNTIDSYVILKASVISRWNDQRLVWNPSSYGGITKSRLFTNPDKNIRYIWTPDLELYENAEVYLIDGLKRPMA